MEKIKKLLEEIRIINKNNADTANEFNVFRICDVNHYENKHSKIISEFLNPKGSHGFKSDLLKQFVERLGNRLKVKNFDCTNASVYRECDTDNGRIDILIEDNQNHALIIENKIYAADQKEQLKRYDTFAEKKYGKGNYQILYLTLFGSNASAQSRGDIDYTPVSYNTDIIGWLEKCVSIAEKYPTYIVVREILEQYKNHLNKLINNNIMDNNPKLRELVVKNIDTIKQIAEIYDVHKKRPSRILWLLSNKLKDVEMGKFEKDENYILLKLDKNSASDWFEIDFSETGIDAYYDCKDTELENKLVAQECKIDEFYYTSTDEEIADDIAKQINAIIAIINGK